MKKSILVLLLILGSSCYTMADMIITENGTHYGKITEIDNQTISMREGCGNNIYTTFWNSRTRIVFSDQCQPPAVEASTSPITAEFSCDKATVFTLNFSNITGTFYCTAISFSGSDFSFQLYDGRRFIYRNFKTLTDAGAIGFESICKTFIKSPSSIPSPLQSN